MFKSLLSTYSPIAPDPKLEFRKNALPRLTRVQVQLQGEGQRGQSSLPPFIALPPIEILAAFTSPTTFSHPTDYQTLLSPQDIRNILHPSITTIPSSNSDNDNLSSSFNSNDNGSQSRSHSRTNSTATNPSRPQPLPLNVSTNIPTNRNPLFLLIRYTIERMEQIAYEEPLFPGIGLGLSSFDLNATPGVGNIPLPALSSLSSLPGFSRAMRGGGINLGRRGGKNGEQIVKEKLENSLEKRRELMNCLRLVMRVLPFVWEESANQLDEEEEEEEEGGTDKGGKGEKRMGRLERELFWTAYGDEEVLVRPVGSVGSLDGSDGDVTTGGTGGNTAGTGGGLFYNFGLGGRSRNPNQPSSRSNTTSIAGSKGKGKGKAKAEEVEPLTSSRQEEEEEEGLTAGGQFVLEDEDDEDEDDESGGEKTEREDEIEKEKEAEKKEVVDEKKKEKNQDPLTTSSTVNSPSSQPPHHHQPSTSTPNKPPSQPPLGPRLLSLLLDLLFLVGFSLPEEVLDNEELARLVDEADGVVQSRTGRMGEKRTGTDGMDVNGKGANGRGNGRRVEGVIWEPGVGSTLSLPSYSPILAIRLEILKLLLTLLSKSLYISPSPSSSESNPYLATLLTTTPRKVVLSLLCSLLNTAFVFGGGGQRIEGVERVRTQSGVGTNAIMSAASNVWAVVPVDRLMGKRTEDPKPPLVQCCMQLLAILLVDCTNSLQELFAGSETMTRSPSTETLPSFAATERPAPHSRRVSTSLSVTPINARSKSKNPFLFYLTKLHRPADFEFIIDGLMGLFNASLAQESAVRGLIGTVGAVSGGSGIPPTGQRKSSTALGVGEGLVLLWKLIENNQKFLNYVLETGSRGCEILLYLLYFSLESKDDPSQLGTIRLCVYILQTLSAESAFGSRLNMRLSEVKIGNSNVKTKYASGVNVGTVADYLIVSIYSLIFSTKSRLSSLYPFLIITLSNASPYLKELSVTSSTRLMQLFLAFSSPSFVLMEEGNPRLVYYMLEVFNNLIHYQMSDNPHLMYNLLRSGRRFEELANFTLSKGVADIKRQKEDRIQRKQHQSGKLPPDNKSSAPITSPSSGSIEGMDEEKAAVAAYEARTRSGGVTDGESTASGGASRRGSSDGLVVPPLSSPTTSISTTTSDGISEKKRGKMREVIVPDDDDADGKEKKVQEQEPEVEYVERWEGKNGFVATEDWVASWREGLPLDSILIMISELHGKVTSLCTHPSPNQSVINFLRSATLVGILPSPQPQLKPRKFQPTIQSTLWTCSLVWGWVFTSWDYYSSFVVGGAGGVPSAYGSSAGGGGHGLNLSFRNTQPRLFTVQVNNQGSSNRAVGAFESVAGAGRSLFSKVVTRPGQTDASTTTTATTTAGTRTTTGTSG